jgi:endonuclease-3
MAKRNAAAAKADSKTRAKPGGKSKPMAGSKSKAKAGGKAGAMGKGDKPVSARQAGSVLKKLAELYPRHPLNVRPREPFQVLIATVLSSRTKDPTTNAAMERLWARAATPQAILAVPADELAELIKPVGFYRTKAAHLHQLCRQLIVEHGGRVPATREELVSLSGVGRKVANLVLNICFDTAAICVDTHVHRIANRLGWVATDSPEETEYALMELVPERYWTQLNRVLVNHGQQVCHPISPRCSACEIVKHCQQVGVIKNR